MNAARSWQVTGRLLGGETPPAAASPTVSSCHPGPLLQQLGHQARPAGLMAGADAAAGVGVEILVERHPGAPVRIVIQPWVTAEHGAPALTVLEEEAAEPRGDVVGDLGQRPHASRAGGALHREPVAEIVV